jgi:hypothetical protein
MIDRMATWHLLIKTTHGDYDITVGPDEPKALAALQEAGDNIGMNGRTTIAERLVLEASTIQSAMIVRRG